MSDTKLKAEQYRRAAKVFYDHSAGCNPTWNTLDEIAACLQYPTNQRLLDALKAVVIGNDIAYSRKQTLESWPDSSFRRQALDAIQEAEAQ